METEPFLSALLILVYILQKRINDNVFLNMIWKYMITNEMEIISIYLLASSFF